MTLESILSPDRTLANLAAGSKKRAIEIASEHIGKTTPELRTEDIYRGLIEREKRGTTAIGKGVAIPHCRLDTCKTILGGLFILNQAADFDAFDETLVKIMFVLLVPRAETTKHLEVLAMLAGRFAQETYRKALTTAQSDDDLYQLALLDPSQATSHARSHVRNSVAVSSE